jgi:hypothetical protein
MEYFTFTQNSVISQQNALSKLGPNRGGQCQKFEFFSSFLPHWHLCEEVCLACSISDENYTKIKAPSI